MNAVRHQGGLAAQKEQATISQQEQLRLAKSREIARVRSCKDSELSLLRTSKDVPSLLTALNLQAHLASPTTLHASFQTSHSPAAVEERARGRRASSL